MSASELERIGHLSLAELKATPMTFGKTHLGKTYDEIWVSDPQWIKWFMGHYSNSGKTDHRKMIRFIQMKIEESEAETPQPSAKSLPKALAARPKSQVAPVIHLDGPNEEEEFENLERMNGWQQQRVAKKSKRFRLAWSTWRMPCNR